MNRTACTLRHSLLEVVKGNTSSGATKEVTVETGYTLQVPQFIAEGDVIAINTESRLYLQRVAKA